MSEPIDNLAQSDTRELLAEIERLNEELAATKAHLAEGQDFIAIADVTRAEVERLKIREHELAVLLNQMTGRAFDERDRADKAEAKCIELAERLVVAAAQADIGRELMRQAWYELNTIRARSGAPEGVDEAWFGSLVDQLASILGDEAVPWMLGAAKDLAKRTEVERDAALTRVAELQVTAGSLTDRVTELEQAAELNHDKRLMIISRAETAEADVARLRGACNFVLHALRYDEEHAHFRSSHSIGGIREAIREALAAQPTESLKLYGAPPVEASRLTGVLRADPREVVSTESPLSSSASVGAGESHRESPSGAADKGEPAFKKVRPECSGCGCGCRGRPKCDCCCACIGELRCDVVCGQCGTGDAP
jgi:hypothetical protein